MPFADEGLELGEQCVGFCKEAFSKVLRYRRLVGELPRKWVYDIYK